MSYTPSAKILENYANVLVNYALGGGKGIKKGDVVYVWAKECTKPLYVAVCEAIWKSGGHVIDGYTTNETARRGHSTDFYQNASDEQLDFFADKYWKGMVEQIDHQLAILGEADLHGMKGIDSGKVTRHAKAFKPYMDWRDAKENAGKLTWTLGLYGTEAMAQEANMSIEDYWRQIVKACFLDEVDPIAKWKEVSGQIKQFVDKLNALQVVSLQVVSRDCDLTIAMGKNRKWNGGGGRNIPSFEIFTSPDWRGINGWIRFNQPLYRYGRLITGIELKFSQGRVIESKAKTNEAALRQMIATENADKVGEFSLTDNRHSRIDRFMAETLYDENMGGEFGNTHIALGSSYHDCYDGDMTTMTKQDWEALGFNDSSVHTDMFSTVNRTVTAMLIDGSKQIIYKDGQFQI